MMHQARLFALSAAIATLTAAPAFAQNSASAQNLLRVQLSGFRSNKGTARCSLFNDRDPSAFPSNGDKVFKLAMAPSIKNETAEVDFSMIPPGKYAVVCYHDENGNGKFDENLLGMPKEGYCFSNNIKPKFSAPNFDQCAFDYKGGDQSIAITMIYLY
jgi:uncharacterized protein (DUF2141 family)